MQQLDCSHECHHGELKLKNLLKRDFQDSFYRLILMFYIPGPLNVTTQPLNHCSPGQGVVLVT